MNNTAILPKSIYKYAFPKIYDNVSFEKITNNEYYVKNRNNGIISINNYVLTYILFATGQNSIIDICKKMGIATNNDNLIKINDLYVKLHNCGIINYYNTNQEFKERKHFHHSITILNDRIVNSICQKLKFLYTPKIVLTTFICFILLLSVSFFLIGNESNYQNCNPFITCTLLLISFFAHEFGHSTALCYYGKKSGRIGVGLLMFAPIMFSDVSDCWSLTNRKRAIVDLGGLYFQIVLISVLLLAFTITKIPDFIYSSFLSITIGLLNLNPFIKMDGYWLLSDIFDIKNLKTKALNETRSFVKNLLLNHKLHNTSNKLLILYYLLNSLFAIFFFILILQIEIKLFIDLPSNIETLLNQISINKYHDISIQLIESIFLPIILLFILLLLGKRSFDSLLKNQ